MGVAINLQQYLSELEPQGCQLVAVSKTKPNELVLEAYEAGHRDFGENKVQDLVAKYEALPKDINWHMIGHLQRNKVKYLAPFVHLIHGIDTIKLLVEVNKEAEKNDRIIPCLLQVHIAEEETKFGLNNEEIHELMNSDRLNELTHVNISGLMGMATYTEDTDQIRKEFKSLKVLFEEIKSQYSFPNVEMNILSMGMSGDYKIAIEEGSNMVRIGTAIFGARNTPQPLI